MRGRPPSAYFWSKEELGSFREALRCFMLEQGFDPLGLEKELGYRSSGYLVRTYLGEMKHDLPPSQPFLERLTELGFKTNGHRPSTLHHIRSGVVALADLPPGTVILGEPRQCPECVAESSEGERHPVRTWYVYPYACQIYCCRRHRRAWYRRVRSASRGADGLC